MINLDNLQKALTLILNERYEAQIKIKLTTTKKAKEVNAA